MFTTKEEQVISKVVFETYWKVNFHYDILNNLTITAFTKDVPQLSTLTNLKEYSWESGSFAGGKIPISWDLDDVAKVACPISLLTCMTARIAKIAKNHEQTLTLTIYQCEKLGMSYRIHRNQYSCHLSTSGGEYNQTKCLTEGIKYYSVLV